MKRKPNLCLEAVRRKRIRRVRRLVLIQSNYNQMNNNNSLIIKKKTRIKKKWGARHIRYAHKSPI